MSRSRSTVAYSILALGLVAAAPGCAANTGSPSSSGDTGGVDVANEALETADRGTSSTAIADTKSVSELFVQEDPTINPADTPAANAGAMAKQLLSSIQDRRARCGDAKVTHADGDLTVSVDFGSGCTLPAIGLTLSGAVSASISRSGSTITVDYVFTNLTANALSLNGTASESTTSGTSYSWNVDVTADGNPASFEGTAALDADHQGLTLNGHGTWGKAAIQSQSVGVHHTFGSCYADAGTLSFTKSVVTAHGSLPLTEVVTFSSSTPTTGQVEVSIDGVSSTETLPSYGHCS